MLCWYRPNEANLWCADCPWVGLLQSLQCCGEVSTHNCHTKYTQVLLFLSTGPMWITTQQTRRVSTWTKCLEPRSMGLVGVTEDLTIFLLQPASQRLKEHALSHLYSIWMNIWWHISILNFKSTSHNFSRIKKKRYSDNPYYNDALSVNNNTYAYHTFTYMNNA